MFYLCYISIPITYLVNKYIHIYIYNCITYYNKLSNSYYNILFYNIIWSILCVPYMKINKYYVFIILYL